MKNKSNFAKLIGKNEKQYWKSGTGYGHDGQAKWDINFTIKAKNEKEKQINQCIRNLTKHLTKLITINKNINILEILKNSCYVPYILNVFEENPIMELLKNYKNFESLLNLMRIIPNNLCDIFFTRYKNRSLFDIFMKQLNDYEEYLNLLKKISKKNY